MLGDWGAWDEGRRRTTCRASLAAIGDAVKARRWAREAMLAGRKAALKAEGVSLDAIVAVRGRNGWVGELEVENYCCR